MVAPSTGIPSDLVVKLLSAGTRVWRARYVGPGAGPPERRLLNPPCLACLSLWPPRTGSSLQQHSGTPQGVTRTPRSTTQPHSAHLIFTAASLLHPEDPQKPPHGPHRLGVRLPPHGPLGVCNWATAGGSEVVAGPCSSVEVAGEATASWHYLILPVISTRVSHWRSGTRTVASSNLVVPLSG